MLWLNDWELCRGSDCRDRGTVPGLRTRSAALQWLGQYKNDSPKMVGMRNMLVQEQKHAANQSEQAVIEAVAELLASGRVHVHMQAATRRKAGGPAAETSAPFPLSERGSRGPSDSSSQPAGDAGPATLSPANDAAAQAATLQAAAADGKPFCPE